MIGVPRRFWKVLILCHVFLINKINTYHTILNASELKKKCSNNKVLRVLIGVFYITWGDLTIILYVFFLINKINIYNFTRILIFKLLWKRKVLRVLNVYNMCCLSIKWTSIIFHKFELKINKALKARIGVSCKTQIVLKIISCVLLINFLELILISEELKSVKKY